MCDIGGEEECHPRSGSTSPQDPLAPLSDYAADSLCSSWGSEDSFPVNDRHDLALGTVMSTNTLNAANESVDSCVDWQQQYLRLCDEMPQFQTQADQMKSMMYEKLSELQLRVVEAESRAEMAESKVRLMEDRLHQSSSEWASLSQAPTGIIAQMDTATATATATETGTETETETETETVDADNSDTTITKLAFQVEEQRQLRMQDAKFVEAKAARIKEWVTNKLKELEAQNQHLREQNIKCNQQLELLRRHMAQLNSDRLAESFVSSVRSSSQPSSLMIAADTDTDTDTIESSPSAILLDTKYSENLVDAATNVLPATNAEPVYAQVDRESKKHSNNEIFAHRRHLSASCTSAASIIVDSSNQTTTTTTTTTPLASVNNNYTSTDTDARASFLSLVRPKSAFISSDQTHDYAEIYTPSQERVDCWKVEGKPPTPPLHRFPSWESRIYRVADEGLSNVTSNQSDRQSSPVRHSSPSYANAGYYDMSCPVYATVKGRASQIRSSPFSEDSTDDSSDNDDHLQLHDHNTNMAVINARMTNSSADNSNTDNSVSSYSPSRHQSIKTNSTLSPIKCNFSSSPSKNTSFESGISDDYALPPDAFSCGGDSTEWSTIVTAATCSSPNNYQKLHIGELCFERWGNLAKLGGKLKTWQKRWFHLSSAGILRYWKSQNEVNRKPRGEIAINELCTITRADGATTFEISTPKKTYYLTAESLSAMEDWLRTLQNVQTRNASKALFAKDNLKPTIQGWLTKVRNGHSKKCWCVLDGKTLLYFKSAAECANNPTGQINMKEANVEQVEHVSDSDSDEKEDENQQKFTIGIFPRCQPPTYLLLSSKQEMDSWLYHLTVVSGGKPHIGTQYEQCIQKLMESDGDAANIVWKQPLLLYSKESISTPLTSIPENLICEALKLFKSCQLFMSVAVESTGIDYHVVLAQNALQQSLDYWQLQAELICALIKQTSAHSAHKMGVQVLSKLRHRSLFACDTAVATPTTINTPAIPSNATNMDACKANPPNFVFLQGWQLLALVVSLFVPKDQKILWYLKCHIRRNSDIKSECGKYAAYCERALERTIQNGNRLMKPSRMEVLSILMKNPYHHSLPHSIPVHFLNATYQVVGFDGSTTVREFLKTLAQDIGCRDATNSGFTLFSDDPIEKDLEHYIDPIAKLCDVISKWETVLREKGSGKFENTKVIQLTFKNRLYFKNSIKNETDREKLLLCYQTNLQIVHGRFPLTKELALELAALMAQIDFGEFCVEKCRASGGANSGTNSSNPNTTCKEMVVLQAVDKFYPYRYRDNLSSDALKELQNALQHRWQSLKGRNTMDCVRIYLTCTRKWPFFGAYLFQAKWKQGGENMSTSSTTVSWLAITEDGISLLELGTMQMVASYSYSQVLTFGGCQEDFMIVINNDGVRSQRLLFSLSKPKILELTLIIADYMNTLGQAATLNRHNMQPDILKSTPDRQFNTAESKKYSFDSAT